MAKLIGTFSYLISSKTRKVIRINLEICYPEYGSEQLDILVKNNILENAKLAMEFPTAWFSNRTKIQSLLKKISNNSLVEEALEKKSPLIIAVPHLGNWEFFWHWMQLNFPTIGMYSPASNFQFDKLILNSRKRFGGQPFATDSKGLISLLKALKAGSVMMILPDQVPRKNAGIYTPFFGQSAYTMTLLHRFIRKTGASLLFGSCLRDENSVGFNIKIEAPDFTIDSESVENFNSGMNLQIESMIRQTPEQYQWAYKRFKNQQDGVSLYKK